MNKLAKIRADKLIPMQDMVDLIRKHYPKMDKPLLSKVLNGDLYGVDLRPDAVKMLLEKFAPEELGKPVKENRRLKCRISGRLEDGQYAALQRRIKADGYSTVQDWIADMVRDYNKEHDDEHT